MTLTFNHRFAQFFALVCTLFTTNLSSSAMALTHPPIITDTPVSSIVVTVEDLGHDNSTDLQRIRLRIAGTAELSSDKTVSINLSEDQVAVSIPDIPGALSVTSLYRNGNTVVGRERLTSGDFFTIGRVGDNQDLELNSDYHFEVEYRQYRYKLTDHMIAFILGTAAKNSGSVMVAIVKN